MDFFGIGKMLSKQKERQKESEALKTEANNFQLATDGGYLVVLKYALFVLFAFYNARLFLTTIPGWERYMTALFALLGECTALYCFNKFPRSTGSHKKALGVFAVLLFVFCFTHATISFFRMERGEFSEFIRLYCERVAFPLLFGLLLLAAIIIPLLHWRAKVAAKQAEAQTRIESDRADLVAETATMRNQAALERQRLEHFEEEIKLGNEYVGKLKRYAQMKRDEYDALMDIPEPMRSQIANQLGLDLSAPSSPQKPVVAWQGGRIVEPPRGN